MKKFFPILSVFLSATFYGQSVSNFQYILIPEKFKDEKANKYGLNALLSSKLKSKKFVIFTENYLNQPIAVSNPCEILKAEVTDSSTMFTNKVRVDFRDCNEKIVASLEGKSTIKEFEEGMRAALSTSLNNLLPSNPSAHNLITKQKPIGEITQFATQENAKLTTDISNASLSEVTINGQNKASDIIAETIVKAENSAPKAEIYTNGIVTLNKIVLSDSEFILAAPTIAVPYALFKASAKKDVFRVQLQDGTQTFGYKEAGKIIIELTDADGSFKREIFERK